MTLATGQVTTVERVGSFSLPEESSTWVAMHRGNGGGGRGGRGGRGAAADAARRRRRQPQVAARRAAAEGDGRARAAPRAKRKDAGSDLIVRNLATGQDVTIPLVTEYAWTKDGAWLAYAVSSTEAEEDGAFARQMSDGDRHDAPRRQGPLQGPRVRRERARSSRS